MNKKVVVRHFHEGNDADRAIRGPASYATVARVVDLDTGEIVSGFLVKDMITKDGRIIAFEGDRVLAEFWAFCNPKDSPTRKFGRTITIGRLREYLPEVLKDASWGMLPEGKQ